MEEKDYRLPIAISSGVILTILYFEIMLTEGPEQWISSFFGNYEILIYIGGCAFFVLIFTIVFCVDKVYVVLKQNAIFLCIMFIGFMAINNMFENSKGVQFQSAEIYYTSNKFLLIFIVVGICAVAAIFDKAPKHVKIVLCVCAVGASVIITAIGLYSPNIAINDYQIVHNSATFDSIYNLYMGEPVSRTSFGTYGHYEFFYLLWFKLVKLTMKRYVITQCAVGVVTLLLFIYCVWNLVKNKIVCAFSILCMSGIWGQMTYSTVTHTAIIRLFPTAIMSAFIVFCSKRKFVGYKRNAVVIIGYVLCALLILWNPEMGIISSLGWAFYCIWLKEINKSEGKIANLVFCILFHVGGIVLSFFASFFLCNLFNNFCGGEYIDLSTFMIPYTDKTYMTDGLILPLQKLNYPWFWVVMVGLIIFIKGWADILVHKVIGGRKAISVGSCLSVILLAGVTYFINRSAAGCLWISYLSGVVILALLCDETIFLYKSSMMTEEERGNSKKQIYKALSCISMVLLCGLLTCVGYVLVNLSGNRFEYDAYCESEELLRSMMRECPPDTYGIGLGIPMFYSKLGWDDGYHLASEAFHTEEGVNHLKKCLLDDNPKIISSYVLSGYTYAGLFDASIYDQVYAKFDIENLGVCMGYEYWYLKPKGKGRGGKNGIRSNKI